MRRTWLAAVLVLGCGGTNNRLNGTISSEASLVFDQVRAEWLVDQLSVRYLSGDGLTLQEPVRLTLPAAAVDAGVELAIDRHVQVEHYVTSDDAFGKVVPEKPFPPVSHGVLHLTRVSTRPGDLIEGDFQVTFTGAEDTLNGEFSATVATPH